MKLSLLFIFLLCVISLEGKWGRGRSSSRSSSRTSSSSSSSGRRSWFSRRSSSSSRSSYPKQQYSRPSSSSSSRRSSWGSRPSSSSSSRRSSYSVSSSRSSWGSRPSSSSSSSSTSSSRARKSTIGKIKDKLGFGRRKSSTGTSASSFPKQSWSSGSKPGVGTAGAIGALGAGGLAAGAAAGAQRSSAFGTSSGFGSTSSSSSFGGGGFTRPSSSSLGGGGFVKPSASGFNNPGVPTYSGGGFSKPSTSSFGSAGGFTKPGTSSFGSGGFTKPSSSGFGLGTAGKGLAAGGMGALAAGALAKKTGGFGGFSKPSSTGFGGSSSGFGGLSKPSSTGFGGSGAAGALGGLLGNKGGSSSGLGKKLAGGAALAGGLGLGGLAASKVAKHYSYPKKASKMTQFTNLFRKKPKTMSSAGYGTAWGTNFGADNKYKPKKGFSKKALGLGVAAGFVGGAALGVVGTKATYGVYHRYKKFKDMMKYRGFHHQPRYSSGYHYDDDFYDDNYYNSYYNRNECFGGCPANSHCEWGFCECDYGFERRFGRCGRIGSVFSPRPAQFDPFAECLSTQRCQNIDINMVCNTRLTVQEGGKCQCKQDMKWNEAAAECQMFLDVDCSAVTYDTPPSAGILSAVQRAQANNIAPPPLDLDRTPTIQESVGASLLSQLDRERASEAELREAFCRDVDAYSFDLNVDDGRPPRCDPVPRTACGVVYDESDCHSGWKLIITEGEISFPYFSHYFKYRNDIELIGVKAGCTLTAYSNTGFTNQRGTFRADSSDFWWDLSEYAEYKHLDEDIESIQCVCRRF